MEERILKMNDELEKYEKERQRVRDEMTMLKKTNPHAIGKYEKLKKRLIELDWKIIELKEE